MRQRIEHEMQTPILVHLHETQFTNFDKMDWGTLRLLEQMVKDAHKYHGWNVRINSDYREGDKGNHGKGIAVDLVFYKEKPGDVPLLEQLLFALRYPWGGIGFYPYWNAPGIHVDSRPTESRREIWWRKKSGEYVAGDYNLTEANLTRRTA